MEQDFIEFLVIWFNLMGVPIHGNFDIAGCTQVQFQKYSHKTSIYLASSVRSITRVPITVNNLHFARAMGNVL